MTNELLTPTEALDRAVQLAGGTQKQLADALTRIGYNCDQATISMWFSNLAKGKHISRFACGPIEAVTALDVRAEWLRPDTAFRRNKHGYVVGFADGRSGRWTPPRRFKRGHRSLPVMGASS